MYSDYQQPVLKRPTTPDAGVDPTGEPPSPEPLNGLMPVPPGPQDQSTALQQVQQAYMQPNPAPPAPVAAAAPPAYSPGQGAGMFLGDFLKQQAATPSLNDSALQPIVAAGRFADQRSADRQRAALAEQLGAAGLGSSGAMNVAQGKIQQQQGETQALRESGLLQDETNARRANLLAGLGQDAGRYQFDQSAGIDLARLEALLNQQATAPFTGGY